MADAMMAPIIWKSIYIKPSFAFILPDAMNPRVMAGLMWQPEIPPIV